MGRVACIFADTLEGFAWKYTLGCIDSDRRDAELMLRWQRNMYGLDENEHKMARAHRILKSLDGLQRLTLT